MACTGAVKRTNRVYSVQIRYSTNPHRAETKPVDKIEVNGKDNMYVVYRKEDVYSKSTCDNKDILTY